VLALTLNFASFNMGDEKGLTGHYGYDHVASMMSSRNSPLAILRRFGKLEMLNLLSLQAELMQLEEDFDIVIRENAGGKYGDFVETFDYSFMALRKAHKEIDDRLKGKVKEATKEVTKEQLVPLERGHKQYELLLRIRTKLKEYGSSPSPSSKVLRSVFQCELIGLGRQGSFACC